MSYHLTEYAARVLVEIDDAGSCAVVDLYGIARLLAAGEMIKCMPDTSLRLLAFGFLESDGAGRLQLTRRGQMAADVYRESGMLWRDEP